MSLAGADPDPHRAGQRLYLEKEMVAHQQGALRKSTRQKLQWTVPAWTRSRRLHPLLIRHVDPLLSIAILVLHAVPVVLHSVLVVLYLDPLLDAIVVRLVVAGGVPCECLVAAGLLDLELVGDAIGLEVGLATIYFEKIRGAMWVGMERTGCDTGQARGQ